MHNIASSGFSKQTAAYDANRPQYPAAAVAFIVEQLWKSRTATNIIDATNKNNDDDGTRHVLDLASGTGIFTRLLWQHFQRVNQPLSADHTADDVSLSSSSSSSSSNPVRTLRVTAVEPVEAMRSQLLASSPQLPLNDPKLFQLLDGTATSIPLPDASCDAVTIAQAFHWFASPAAVREIHRVLKPGTGRLFLIWNLEDGRAARWMARLRAEYELFEQGTPQYRLGLWKQVWRETDTQKLFEYPLHLLDKEEEEHEQVNEQHQVFRHWKHASVGFTADRIWNRILSKSYISVLEPAKQDALKQQVIKILKEEEEEELRNTPSQTSGPKLWDVPHVCNVYMFIKK